MPIGDRLVSTLQARVVLVVILAIMAWGEYHTNSQLNSFHQSNVTARDAEYTATLKNHALLVHVRAQLAHAELQLALLRKGQP